LDIPQSSPSLFSWKELKNRWAKVLVFLKEDIWSANLDEVSSLRKFTFWILRVFTIVVRGFGTNHCRLRAAALTYATVFSLIPLLALAFAMAGAFRGRIQEKVDALKFNLISKLAPSSTGEFESVVGQINEFIDNYHNLSFGAIGAIILVYCAISLLSQIEGAVNETWGVRDKRPLVLSIWMYWGVVTLGTIVLSASLSLTTLPQLLPGIRWLMDVRIVAAFITILTPYCITSVFLSLIYKFLPNTNVRLWPALAGGIVAGLLWETSKGIYVFYVAVVLDYGSLYIKVYSTLAAIPLFLIWIHFSWIIFLLGAEISFAVQNMVNYRLEREARKVSQRYRELLALRMTLLIARNFALGRVGPTDIELAKGTQSPLRLIQDLLHDLTQTGLVVETAQPKGCYIPAMPLENLSPHSLLKELRALGGSPKTDSEGADLEFARDLLKKEELAEAEALDSLNFRTLIDELGGKVDLNLTADSAQFERKQKQA